MSPNPQRVAVYLRMSTEDQEPENQLIQLREFYEWWEGHKLAAEYGDREFVHEEPQGSTKQLRRWPLRCSSPPWPFQYSVRRWARRSCPNSSAPYRRPAPPWGPRA